MKINLNKYQDRFKVVGHFYIVENEKYRKNLEIKSVHCKKLHPDIVFIMMNPGSSAQAEGYQNIFDSLVPVIYDRTQEKIMKLMEIVNFQFARIINLSDYCNEHSQEFYKRIPSLEISYPSHTIFHNSREQELMNLVPMDVPVILGWGVHQKLNVLSKRALEILKKRTSIYGLLHERNSNGYYHPLRRVSKIHELSWLEEIKNEFLND